MDRPVHLRIAVLSAMLVLLATCGPAAPPSPGATTARPQSLASPDVSIPLDGTEWVLSFLRGQNFVAGPPTLAFYESNYLEGSAGCNSFGVNYTVSGQEFHLAQIHRTDFECQEPPGIMPQDDAFFEALASIAAYQAAEDRLEFRNSAGETILVYARKRPAAVDPALQDTEWLLTSLKGDSLLEGSRITLNLDTEGFEGFAGCNNYGGEYEAADGGTLLTSKIFHTLVDCRSPEGIMEQETAYLQALRSSTTYHLADGRLEIADSAGETTLVFARKEEFGTDPTALLGTMWRLVSIDGSRASEGSTSTLTFYSESILGGHAGCGDYLAAYQTSGDDLNLLMEAMFDAACREEGTHIAPEEQFLAAVAPRADLRLGESRLEIYGERGGVLLFEPLHEQASLDLEGPSWSFLAFIGPNPYADEPEPWPVPDGLLLGTTIDLAFEGNAARGFAGCNSYAAAYSRAGSSLRFEAVTATEMACPEPVGIMEQEIHYLELLAAVTSYHIFGDRLWLETGDGQALVFFAGER